MSESHKSLEGVSGAENHDTNLPEDFAQLLEKYINNPEAFKDSTDPLTKEWSDLRNERTSIEEKLTTADDAAKKSLEERLGQIEARLETIEDTLQDRELDSLNDETLYNHP